MSDEKRCKTCRHWASSHGMCQHPKVGAERAFSDDGANVDVAWIAFTDDDAAICTGPEFGCIHWEAKPAAT